MPQQVLEFKGNQTWKFLLTKVDPALLYFDCLLEMRHWNQTNRPPTLRALSSLGCADWPSAAAQKLHPNLLKALWTRFFLVEEFGLHTANRTGLSARTLTSQLASVRKLTGDVMNASCRRRDGISSSGVVFEWLWNLRAATDLDVSLSVC